MRQRWLMAVLVLVLAGATNPVIARAADAKFLLVSDIHFNPMADPAPVSELAAAEPAQWEPILERTTPTTFSPYGSDTNWWLLKSAMKQLPATLRHPTLVMVTGDFLAHNFPANYQSATHDADPEHYRAFVLKTVEFLALELQRNFPGTKIFITPGNNDNDCGDYTIEANGDFLNNTAGVARNLAGGDDRFAASWKALGSFNVPHPTLPGVRIFSLNSIFLSQKYQALSSAHGCAPVSSTAAADLLQWLEQNLAAAAQANQKVWLMFHIPPGIDGYASAMKQQSQIKGGAPDNADTCGSSIVPMWVPEWTAKFDSLLAKYHSTVIASFAAHTHSDDYRLIGAAGPEREFVLMNPAISPIYSQNPGFRVVSYNRNGVVTDQSTYYLTNLPVASAKQKGRWKKEYTFTRQWKTGGLNAASLGQVYDEVVADDSARANWLKLYAVSGPALEGGKPIARALYCAVEGLSVEGYRQCDCGAKP
ncbi:MAG: metallophosphoesterase [Candidatus Korobacteraceae bacterium]